MSAPLPSSPASPDRYAHFPAGFFDRSDDGPDDRFYEPARLVTHIDDGAIAAVGGLYRTLGIDGSAPEPRHVLDLMSSWVSHFQTPPTALTVIGMNRSELDANRAATARVVHDLNVDPSLPCPDQVFDAATCCVSVDYLVRPLEVFDEVARVLRPGAPFVLTFSNRCFPTKAIRGWLYSDDDAHCRLVAEYFVRSGPWNAPEIALCTVPGSPGDPLWAVWALRA